MEENPYQSPRSVPEVEKPSEKRLSRYFIALLCSLGAWAGLTLSVGMGFYLLEFVLQSEILYPKARALTCALIAAPVGPMIASWYWRAPKSKWPAVVSVVLGLSPLGMAGVLSIFT